MRPNLSPLRLAVCRLCTNTLSLARYPLRLRLLLLCRLPARRSPNHRSAEAWLSLLICAAELAQIDEPAVYYSCRCLTLSASPLFHGSANGSSTRREVAIHRIPVERRAECDDRLSELGLGRTPLSSQLYRPDK